MAVGSNDFVIPKEYKPTLGLKETEVGIKKIKDFFEANLAKELNLTRVSAPLFVVPETGLNDNLNGVETPVNFNVKGADNVKCEIVHSLAKWKRMALKKYDFLINEGLYTDMNAIRKDEDLDNLHSIYVDQWDWEIIVSKEQRNIEYLKDTVRKIYKVFKDTEKYICNEFSTLKPILSDDITFITTQELEDLYPNLTPKEREIAIAKDKGAVFIMKIGEKLRSGIVHDGRAPDYDDWELNGDIVFWYPLLEKAFEVSSMGIRVDENSLIKQLEIANCNDRLKLEFHNDLLNCRLPYSIGGGIGQSRICMFLLNKAHIGEVQASIWPSDMIDELAQSGIRLL